MNEIRLKNTELILSMSKEYSNMSISDLHSTEAQNEKTLETTLLKFDYSKQRINSDTIDTLLQIPEEIFLRDSLSSLFNGELQNPSESRGISHTLYRSDSPKEGFELIYSEKKRIKAFIDQMSTTSTIQNIICISIGGSRAGPQLIKEFLAFEEPVKVFFCSSFDLLELKDALNLCKQKETIIFTVSKSFTTLEITKNLDYAKSWLKSSLGQDIEDHLYGVSFNKSAMTDYGIKNDNQFEILDSLSGRNSIWSSVSIPAFINSDNNAYINFLEGALLADQHTLNSSWKQNIPVIMALLSIWNATALGINNHGIFTYNYRIRSLTRYLSQLSMESNGKTTNHKGEESPFLTSPLVWGGYGIESQHSTFQWLMQGKTETSCDFIGIRNDDQKSPNSEEILFSHVVAAAFGEENLIQPFKSIKGNNPCSVFQLQSLDIKNLGFLLSLYEHKTFIEALILGIDPFDQWGVQLGKTLTSRIVEDEDYLSHFFNPSLLS